MDITQNRMKPQEAINDRVYNTKIIVISNDKLDLTIAHESEQKKSTRQ